jgi:hypothetical protein
MIVKETISGSNCKHPLTNGEVSTVSELKHVATHVPPAQYDVWRKEADEMGASMSQYVKMKVSAGRKKFDRQIEPDKSRAELRSELASVIDELEMQNKQTNSLRRQLNDTERRTIIEFVEENPGTAYGDIRQYLMNTMSGRMAALLSELEGSELRIDEEGRYYAGNHTDTEDYRD